MSENIQIADLIKAMALSEPCLFNNAEANLMPVIIKRYKLDMTYITPKILDKQLLLD